MIPESDLPEIIIPKEKAVFWMDRSGKWHNECGRFEHKKIIDYFNASISKDEGGYFVVQVRESVREKVYFHFEDTPLFVVDVQDGDSTELILNTRQIVHLAPTDLFVSNDILYMHKGCERIRFTDRAMIKLSAYMDYEDGQYWFSAAGKRHILPTEQ